MRHRLATHQLNRNTKQRKSLLKNLVKDIVEVGYITTTEAKAKTVKGLVDKIIHRSQEGTINARRVLAKFFGSKAIVNYLVDEVGPAMKDRSSGFTRITHLEVRRGDASEMVRIELVTKPAVKEVKKVEKKAKPVKAASTKPEAKVEAKAVKPAVKKAK